MSTCSVCCNGRSECVRDLGYAPVECGIQTESEVEAMAEAFDWPEVFDGDW